MFKRFSQWYDALYAVVGVTPSPWRSKAYAPVLASRTWALLSKFLALKPGFEVKISSPENGVASDVDEQAEKARRKLEFDYENPYMDETMRDKLFSTLLDAVVTGTGVAKVCWKVKIKKIYKRVEDKYGNIDLTKEEVTTKKIAYNDIEPVNIFNVYTSKGSNDLYKGPWHIIKENKLVSELQDVNDATGLPMYKNLDKLTGNAKNDEDNSYNQSRNRLIDSKDEVDKSVNMVKIFECYEGDTITTYAEGDNPDEDAGWIEISKPRKNPYWHGKYPLVKFHVKSRPFSFWGEGLFETTYRLQAIYNDAFNHFFDQWNLAENSMLMVPESARVNDYVVEPGGTIVYKGDVPPAQFKHAPPDASGLMTIINLMDRAIEGVTISQYASGVPNSATDKTQGTARGIESLQSAAGDLVSFMRTNFAQGITQIGRMWLSNNQQYMEKPINLMVMRKGRKEQMTVRPQDMQGDMELIVDDSSMDPSNKDRRLVEFKDYMMNIQQMQAASFQQAIATKFSTSPLFINFPALLQDYSQLVGRTDFESLLMNQQETQQAIMAMQQGQPPEDKTQVKMDDLYGTEAAQLLERKGIQPDPRRAEDQEPNEVEKVKLFLQKEEQDAAQQPTPQSVDPDADQSLVDMAHELSEGGHIDPNLMQYLPQLPRSPKEKKEVANV